MVTLKFSLSPEASNQLHGVLQCLLRFSDTVCLEAKDEEITFSALNTTKSAHAAIALGLGFFQTYDFISEDGRLDGRFTCCIKTKSLLPIFKSRISDAKSSTATELCVVHFQDDPSSTVCRLVAQNFCAHGVVKTYTLTYEATEIMNALFDKATSFNRWAIKAAFLKENLDYFSPKVEQLDIFYDNDKMTFLSYQDKVLSSKNEVLKQPLKTTVILSASDFKPLELQQKLHIVISVRDFKAIVLHADSMDASLYAFYSSPGRPLQFRYGKGALECQFTLTTAGEYRGPAASKGATTTANANARPGSAAATTHRSNTGNMGPPPRPSAESRRQARTLGRRKTQPVPIPNPPQPRSTTSGDIDSLFVPRGENDQRWDPPAYDPEESLEWNTNHETESLFQKSLRERETRQKPSAVQETVDVDKPTQEDSSLSFTPTQRLSQIPRLW